MRRRLISPWILPLSLPLLARIHGADTWHMEWPLSTSQCQQVTVAFTGGTPPWSIVIVPVNQQPLFWTFTSPGYPVNASYPATSTFPLQLEAGTPYSVAVADALDWNRALNNPTTVQVVQPSNDSSCFASAEPAHKDFTFQAYGQAAECEQKFGLTWTTNVGVPPYSFTVIPLDGSYTPWSVALPQGLSNVQWQSNMTAGTRFTVYMNDGYGGGRGGVGDIWEVAAGDNPTADCVKATYNGRGTWPSGVTVASLQASPTPFNSTQTSTGSAAPSSDSGMVASVSQTSSGASQSASSAGGNSGSSSSSSGGLSKGAIAGIAVGAAVGVAILIGLLWFLIARRRKRTQQADIPNGTVDLVGGGGDGEPKIEPYRGDGMPIPVPTGQRDSIYSTTHSQTGHELGHDHGPGAGLAGFSAGAVAAETARHSTSSPLAQNSKGYEGFHALNTAPASTEGVSPITPSTPQTGTFEHGLPPGAEQATRPLSVADSARPGAFGLGGVAPSVSGSSDSNNRDSKRPLPAIPPTSPDPDRALPAIPSGSPGHQAPIREDSGLSSGGRSSPEFRRHTDAGEYNGSGQREVVDLPPLYTDVPRGRNQSADQR